MEKNRTYQDILRKKHRLVKLTWFIFIVILFLYYGLIRVILASENIQMDMPEAQISLFRYLFLGISLAEFLIIRFLKSILLETKMEGNPDVSQLVQKLLSSSIISFAFCEIPAVLGFVLTVMTQNLKECYPFFAISFVGLLFHFPKFDEWEAWMKKKVISLGGGKESFRR